MTVVYPLRDATLEKLNYGNSEKQIDFFCVDLLPPLLLPDPITRNKNGNSNSDSYAYLHRDIEVKR